METMKAYLLQEYPFLESVTAMEIKDPSQDPFIKFQEDKGTSHKGKNGTLWKRKNGISVLLDWPSNSLDLSIIENVWIYIEDRLHQVKDSLWAIYSSFIFFIKLILNVLIFVHLL